MNTQLRHAGARVRAALALVILFGGCAADPAAYAADALVVESSSNALTTTTLTYQANDEWGAWQYESCNTTKNILLVEPDGPGPFPVFIYTVGTLEPHDSAEAKAILNQAAAQGFVAASIDYQTDSLPGFCPGQGNGWYKAQCAYSTSYNPNSAVSVLCARGKAGGCSEGIVVAGFSEGGALAAAARNFDPRVRGAWTMGFGDMATFTRCSRTEPGVHSITPAT
jgi:hypothetical protein